jgi:alkanesulfonate monooxygenase SsuD/methylene tetrahydromethanopterin reductase-like flavin-dependent oxidoreductase (luciferase family)
VRFSIFYEHQLPRPWEPAAEHVLLKNALEQIEIADRVGFDYVWEVEHHFMEEYSHSSAPEVFLAAVSQRTKNIRIGHGIVQLPPGINHPARVAERIATLDLVSDGRVDFGTGESSSAAELGGFGVRREDKRAQWEDAIDAITRMFVEEPFAGWNSGNLTMPIRNVVPKPLQQPHPPLWVACSQRETIRFAGRNGIGALSFSFAEPEDAGRWVKDYYDLIASEECVPAGFAVNPNLAVVLPMMCHEDEATAIERGIDGAHFFGYALGHYYGITPHEPGRTSIWDEFQERRTEAGFAKEVIQADQAPLGVKIMQQGLGALRGAIGTPHQIIELISRYEAVGVDQIGFVLQAGTNTHEDICASLELFGEKVIPRFRDGRDEREAAKAARLAPAIEAALTRREPARTVPPGYRIDEAAEVARAQGGAGLGHGLRGVLSAKGRAEVRTALRQRGTQILGRTLEGRSDSEAERLLRRPLAQAALFHGMARGFRPEKAHGFTGHIQITLTFPASGASPRTWTLTVEEKRATARSGSVTEKPALALRIGAADLLRLGGGANPGSVLLAEGTDFDVQGDITLAMRMVEMFGGPSPY